MNRIRGNENMLVTLTFTDPGLNDFIVVCLAKEIHSHLPRAKTQGYTQAKAFASEDGTFLYSAFRHVHTYEWLDR